MRAIAVALVPFAGACLSVAWWDRVHPLVFGLPFNLFWLIVWAPLTSACLALALRLRR